MSAQKTVTVRIAVAVDPDGKWFANGWHDARGNDAMNEAAEQVGLGETRYWVTAELPVPVREVCGGVEEDTVQI